MNVPRMTEPTQQVLRALLDRKRMYGLEICRAIGLKPGTVHPILARFESIGWLESEPEDIDPSVAGRPRRRYYMFTTKGAQRAHNALELANESRHVVARTRPGLQGGTT